MLSFWTRREGGLCKRSPKHNGAIQTVVSVNKRKRWETPEPARSLSQQKWRGRVRLILPLACLVGRRKNGSTSLIHTRAHFFFKKTGKEKGSGKSRTKFFCQNLAWRLIHRVTQSDPVNLKRPPHSCYLALAHFFSKKTGTGKKCGAKDRISTKKPDMPEFITIFSLRKAAIWILGVSRFLTWI